LNFRIAVNTHDFIRLIKRQADVEKIFLDPLFAHPDPIVTKCDLIEIGAEFDPDRGNEPGFLHFPQIAGIDGVLNKLSQKNTPVFIKRVSRKQLQCRRRIHTKLEINGLIPLRLDFKKDRRKQKSRPDNTIQII